MNPEEANLWRSDVLDEVLFALASDAELTQVLVFKGARILARRIPEARRSSLDIDTNMTAEFVAAYPEREQQREFLHRRIERAIREHFRRQIPVRFEVSQFQLSRRPDRDHPMGWNAFLLKIHVKDLSRSSSRGQPALEVDIASPEALLPTSVEPLEVAGHIINAYSRTRLAGEKLRAYLSSLPSHSKKIRRNGTAVRAKDLYDLAIIARTHPIPVERDFWLMVGREFRLACESRLVACPSVDAFTETWETTKSTYEKGGLLKTVPFAEAESVLLQITRFFSENAVVPFQIADSDMSAWR